MKLQGFFCFPLFITVSSDQFQVENRYVLCKYPALRMSSSLPSSAGTDSFAVFGSYFHLVQEKLLLIRIIRIDTFLWKMMLMNLHFPVQMIKKVSLLFLHLRSLKVIMMWEKVLQIVNQKRDPSCLPLEDVIFQFLLRYLSENGDNWRPFAMLEIHAKCGKDGDPCQLCYALLSAHLSPPLSIYSCGWDG